MYSWFSRTRIKNITAYQSKNNPKKQFEIIWKQCVPRFYLIRG